MSDDQVSTELRAAGAQAGSAAGLQAMVSNAASADMFAVSYLQLCKISYDDMASIAGEVQNPALVYPWGSGYWRCTWGPATDSWGANLAFVATYFYGPGLPVAEVLVIRGTDITDDVWADLWQAFEDLMVLSQVALPWQLGSGARVAQGTLDALQTIMGLSSNGVTLQQYLVSSLGDPANNKPVLVVTGHSLGGCLTTVTAPWLKTALGAHGVTVPIVPVTFAAPTAGNADFMTYYTSTFPYCPRYYNTMDVVPMAWADLEGMKTVYDSCNVPIPDAAALVLDGYEFLMEEWGVSYQQQPTMRAPLNGSCAPNVDDWYSEVLYQHHTSTYLGLMGVSAPAPSVELARRARNRHSPDHRAEFAEAAARLASAAVLAPPPTE